MKYALIFLSGLTIGAVGTYFVIKDKYEEIADQEIESVKAAFGSEKQNAKKPEKKEEKKEDTLIMKDYKKQVKYYNYAPSAVEEPKKGPAYHQISVQDFNDPGYDEYEKAEWTYYEDDILADELGDEVVEEDYMGAIGSEFKDFFEKHPDEDEFYVRNDDQKQDYLVFREKENFAISSEERED